MCQTKAQGGRRCLRHSPATTAKVHYTEQKLVSITKEEIYDVAKELNKEGRKLPAPSKDEVVKFLEKERFVAELDPDLDEKERKLIVKNLEKAKAEAEEQEVSGGAFHAWKNLFKRSLERIRRPLAVAAVGTFLAGSLVACSGGDAPKIDDAPKPSETSISLTIGESAIAGETVTDDLGSYQKLDATPDTTFDESKIDKVSMEANGLTVEDAKKAHEIAVSYIVEDIADNPGIDLTSEQFAPVYQKWTADNASRFTENGEWLNGEGLAEGGHILRIPGGLVRDGKPRIEFIKVTPVGIGSFKNEDGTVGFTTNYDVTVGYRVTDKFVTDYASSKGIPVEGKDKEMLSDGVANVITISRKAGVNVTTDKLISGVNFPGYSTTDSLNPANVQNSGL